DVGFAQRDGLLWRNAAKQHLGICVREVVQERFGAAHCHRSLKESAQAFYRTEFRSEDLVQDLSLEIGLEAAQQIEQQRLLGVEEQVEGAFGDAREASEVIDAYAPQAVAAESLPPRVAQSLRDL